MDAYANGIGTTHYRTIAEITEDVRFNGLLATLDPVTATLLRSERTLWTLAEIARCQELARLERRERLLNDLVAMW